MSIKYSYEPGMCKATHYNGLWPVKYEGYLTDKVNL